MTAINQSNSCKCNSILCYLPDVILAVVLIKLSLMGFSAAQETHDAHEPQISSLIFPLVNFIIFVRIWIFAYFKAIKPALRKQRSAIEESLSAASQALSLAESELAAAKSRLAGLAAEKERLKQEFLEQAQRIEQSIRANAEKTIRDIQRDTQRRISGEFEKAKTEIRAEIAQMASSLARQTLSHKFAAEDDAHLRLEILNSIAT